MKKLLLNAATVAFVACGAVSTAQAGELKLRLHNVNTFDVDSSTSEESTIHIDRNDAVDLNGFSGPQGEAAPTGKYSVDKGEIFKTTIVGGEAVESSAAVIAEERFRSDSHALGGIFEVDIFEITGGATFSGFATFDIEIGGSSDPWFKEDVNCVNALRAGSDNVESQASFTSTGGQSIIAGENNAQCVVQVTEGAAGVFGDRAIGWALPIAMKDCGDLIVSMDITRQDPVSGAPNTVNVSHTIAVCEDSLDFSVEFGGSKIDYFTDFKSFLEPIDDEPHVATLYADIGAVYASLYQNRVWLKADKADDNGVVDYRDIDNLFVDIEFEDLTGIEDVQIDGRSADVLDRINNVAAFVFSTAEVRDLFGIVDQLNGDGDFIKGAHVEGPKLPVTIHAFGPSVSKSTPGQGPIDHQEVILARAEFDLRPQKEDGVDSGLDCTGTAGDGGDVHDLGCVKFTPEIEGPYTLAGLDKTGVNFGPFDWTTGSSSTVRSYFRVTNLPKVDGHGVPYGPSNPLKGHVQVENSSGGDAFKGIFKVDYTPFLTDHDLLLTPSRLDSLLEAGGMTNANSFGRADLTFTFYVNDDGKADMDRLLNTGGVFADYGDNGNDSNSLKAQSCDAGRFGSHVPNKLDPEFVEELTLLCAETTTGVLGEIDRSSVF